MNAKTAKLGGRQLEIQPAAVPCRRCRGLIVVEVITGKRLFRDRVWFRALCVNCGGRGSLEATRALAIRRRP